MPNIAEKVSEAISPLVTEMGYEVVDVEYTKVVGVMNLTIYIDIVKGVSLEDCEKVHMAIDPIIDKLDPTGAEPYVLNVSSPGLDRPFKKLRDYERNYGKEVEVKLYAPLKGKKLFEGVLENKTENVLTIKTDKEEMKIECSKVALVRPLVKF